MSIKVTLTANGDVMLSPETKIKKRNGKTDHTVTWIQGSPTEVFTFDAVDGLVFTDPEAPFSNIKIKDDKITAKDTIKDKSGTHSWHYVITVVDSNGKKHSSEGVTPSATGGRGVIRNED